MSNGAAAEAEAAPRELPKGWRWVKLGDVCEGKIGTRNPALNPEVPFQYVDITSVDNKSKVIGNVKTLVGKGAPSRARQVIMAGDVLVSTTRPNLNAVAHVPAKLGNEICSTGFCVLRSKKELSDEYLFHYVKSPAFVQELSDLVKGALYPAITDRQVRERLIPLPPLPEQKRVAGILNEQMKAVEQARAATEAQLEAAKALPAAYLREVFNSPEAKSWPRKRLGDYVSKIGSGITPLGGRTAYISSGIPLIRSQNVHLNRFELSGLAFITSEQDEIMRGTRVYAGDVLLNITGASIGRVCVAPSEICPANVNQHVSIIRCNDSIVSEFLSFYISNPDFQKHIMDFQAGATRQALTKTLIEDFLIPLPSISEQKKIIKQLLEKMKEAEISMKALEGQLTTISKLPAALLRRAFNGEL